MYMNSKRLVLEHIQFAHGEEKTCVKGEKLEQEGFYKPLRVPLPKAQGDSTKLISFGSFSIHPEILYPFRHA